MYTYIYTILIVSKMSILLAYVFLQFVLKFALDMYLVPNS